MLALAAPAEMPQRRFENSQKSLAPMRFAGSAGYEI
jgi:hypothetical protein